MGKKKKANSDSTRNRKEGRKTEKKLNPFEVKVNRQKHDVLGRKISKHERGMPGVSRSKAIKKRNQTLLKEYEQQFKVNRIVDKRFGEYDSSLTQDDKMIKRYAMERAKLGTKNKFNLNEDDELTHYGQSLAEIEKFEKPPRSDDEDDDDEDKRNNAKIVAEQHFGGFLTKKIETETDDGPKSWKEKMGEMILQSKKAKHERQVEKEETEKLTEDVDAAWKDLRSLVKPNKKKDHSVEDQPAADDYDQAVRSLKFDVRAQATDRLKSEEELAKEEKEKLDRLEADRIRRMKGISEETAKLKSKHKSADDLDDGFQLDEPDVPYVSYKEGQLLSEDPVEHEDQSDEDGESDSEGEEEHSENEEVEMKKETVENNSDEEEEESDDDDEDGDSDSEGEEEEKSMNEEAEISKETVENNSDEDVSDDESDEEAEDSYDDLLSDLEQELEAPNVVKESKLNKKGKKEKSTKETTETQEMEQAKKEIPYTFTAPDSYDSLLDVLEGHDLEGQLTIIDRIKKCHHPSLAAGNKEKLEAFFKILVQFYGDLCIQDPPQLDFVERLLKPLYELTHMFPEQAAQTMIDEIADRQAEFKQICDRKAGRGLFPALDTVMLLKLVSVLFPTSDFYHHVTTPTMLFICQILSQCNVHHGRDVVTGLLLCNMCLEVRRRIEALATVLSTEHFKVPGRALSSLVLRLVPEAINFLHGTLFLACNKEPNKYIKVVPPFKPIGKSVNLLHVSSPCKKTVSSKWSLGEMLGPVIEDETYNNDEFRVQAIQHCVALLEEFSIIYSDLPSYTTMFTPIIDLCKKLPTNHYPEPLKDRIEEFVSVGEERFTHKLSTLVIQKAKPKPLALMEPKIEDGFDGRKIFRKGTKEFNEKQKLLHKYKKELKGARRELKKDTHFIARKRLNDQLNKDRERKRKVKHLMASLSNQEGDYKKMKKGKSSSYF